MMFCALIFVNLVVMFLKKNYEEVYQEKFFNKTDAFPESLQQLVINKVNI